MTVVYGPDDETFIPAAFHRCKLLRWIHGIMDWGGVNIFHCNMSADNAIFLGQITAGLQWCFRATVGYDFIQDVLPDSEHVSHG